MHAVLCFYFILWLFISFGLVIFFSTFSLLHLISQIYCTFVDCWFVFFALCAKTKRLMYTKTSNNYNINMYTLRDRTNERPHQVRSNKWKLLIPNEFQEKILSIDIGNERNKRILLSNERHKRMEEGIIWEISLPNAIALHIPYSIASCTFKVQRNQQTIKWRVNGIPIEAENQTNNTKRNQQQ